MHIFIGDALIIYVKEIKFFILKKRIIPKEIYLKYLFDKDSCFPSISLMLEPWPRIWFTLIHLVYFEQVPFVHRCLEIHESYIDLEITWWTQI